jgi:AraC-like DNA-binding protein
VDAAFDLADGWIERAPAPRLRPVIDRYVGYRMTGRPSGIHRGVPSQYMTLIVSIGDSIDVIGQTDPAQAPRSYRCVIGGLQASAALIAHDGDQEGVAIELTPLGSRVLLGMPARAIWDTSLELSELVGPVGDELWERLQFAHRWGERFTACDEVFSRLAGDDAVVPELQRCWRTLVGSRGRISVDELAARTGYSRQHLGRRFRDEFGLSPKMAVRVVRFERARSMLESVPSFVSIAQVAAACGYYDQAHLNRDFAQLAGASPTELIADPLRIVEDAPFFQDGQDDDRSRWST